MISYTSKNPSIAQGHEHASFQREPVARKVQRGNSNLRRHLTEKLTNREITLAVTSTLSNTPAKIIADATGGSIRAAQNIREGLNTMSLTGFINACRDIPELRALAMEMMGCEAETDPEFVKGITLLINAYVRRHTEDGAP
jgi:hypothetical protein